METDHFSTAPLLVFPGGITVYSSENPNLT